MTLVNKITFVVPQALQQDLRVQVIKDGYGMRGKSKWVTEAVKNLFNMKNFKELVHYGDEMKDFQKVETIVVTKEFRASLEEAIVSIRKDYPSMEGVQSRIIRTAILQRLLCS